MTLSGAWRTALGGALLVGLMALAGCGGGGGAGGSSTPPPAQATPLPDSLSISAPVTAESATAVKFTQSASALPGYTYRWDFGDGSQSTEAAPSHSFARGGDFDVVLTLSNEAGQKREARSKLTITNLANVQGLNCSGAASSGWCVQSPLRALALSDGFMVNANLGWAVTAAGDIYKTIDAGESWEAQTPPVKGRFNTVKFFDADTGWVIGQSEGLALRTIDGGRTWVDVRVQAGVANPAGRFQLVSGSMAYLWPSTDNDQLAYVTVDGGANWRKLAPAPTHVATGGVAWWLNDAGIDRSVDGGAKRTLVLAFAKAGLVAAPGESKLVVHPSGMAAMLFTRERVLDGNGQLVEIKTTVSTTVDGGSTWQRQLAGCGSAARFDCSGLYPTNISADGKTLLGQSNGYFRSSDGGRSWAAVNEVSKELLVVALRDGDTLALTTTYNGSPVYLSRDGGKSFSSSWTPAARGFQIGKLQVQPASGNLIYGLNGDLWFSQTDGRSWDHLFFSFGTFAEDSCCYPLAQPQVAMRDARRGFLVDGFGVVRQTGNGGKNWLGVREGVLPGAERIQFIDDKIGWFSKYDYDTQTRSIYRTEDGGQSWVVVNTQPGYAVDFRFESDKIGWIRTPFSYRDPPLENERGYTFQVTQDGGRTWQAAPVPSGTYDLRLTSAPGRWVVSGERGLLATSTTAGASWLVAPATTTDTLSRLTVADSANLWAWGKTAMVRSQDGGLTWAPASMPCSTVGDMAFANAKVGWATCGWSLLATLDGGATWQAQPTPAKDAALSRIVISDPKTVWVAGDGNTVLATGTGGQ